MSALFSAASLDMVNRNDVVVGVGMGVAIIAAIVDMNVVGRAVGIQEMRKVCQKML